MKSIRQTSFYTLKNGENRETSQTTKTIHMDATMTVLTVEIQGYLANSVVLNSVTLIGEPYGLFPTIGIVNANAPPP
jgi:hypothetical protein